jgi:hypothetical protein
VRWLPFARNNRRQRIEVAEIIAIEPHLNGAKILI